MLTGPWEERIRLSNLRKCNLAGAWATVAGPPCSDRLRSRVRECDYQALVRFSKESRNTDWPFFRINDLKYVKVITERWAEFLLLGHVPKRKQPSGYSSFFHEVGHSERIQPQSGPHSWPPLPAHTAPCSETRKVEPVLNLLMQLCNISWKIRPGADCMQLGRHESWGHRAAARWGQRGTAQLPEAPGAGTVAAQLSKSTMPSKFNISSHQEDILKGI